MIAMLTGEVRGVRSDRVVLDVNGVGYSITVTPETSERLILGSRISFYTTLVVREDSMTLFGFLEEGARNLFESVQTVSGVGPKVALSLVSNMSVDALAAAIEGEDVSAIEKVPGIGRKGAQRLILELKGKLSTFGSTKPRKGSLPIWHEHLLAALTSLGFTAKEADASITRFVESSSEDPAKLPISELLKNVLAQGRKR